MREAHAALYETKTYWDCVEPDELIGTYVQMGPVSSISFTYDMLLLLARDKSLTGVWGVSVPTRFEGLFPEFDERAPSFARRVTQEGHACVCIPIATPIKAPNLPDEGGETRRALLELMDHEGLGPAGDIVMTMFLPAGDKVYSVLSVPVIAMGERGREVLSQRHDLVI